LESCSLGICLNELVQLEHNEISTQFKLKAAQALFAAVDSCKDGIIITGPNHDIQFTNHSVEKLLGFRGDDILGKNAHDLHRTDSMKADIIDSINMQINKGKVSDFDLHLLLSKSFARIHSPDTHLSNSCLN
jgi:high affinity cAMP-specific and IBMX-insensitive 3',5'-cyclic phosphodiesterase 8